jgi:hypothetical protein
MKKFYRILLQILNTHPVVYNPISVSTILTNSLKNKREWVKQHRLQWLSISLEEAKTQLTKSWHVSIRRIVIGIQDNGCLYILDWRHLLEAYTILQKNIPKAILHFVTPTAKNVFTTAIKSLDS